MHISADEARQSNIQQMGEEVGAIYSALWQEVARIHKKWADYVVLFGTAPERIDLLNKVAPSLFRVMQDSIWEDVLLHLARLTDPATTGKKKNLSIGALVEALKGSSVGPQVEIASKAAYQKTEFVRDWRNRRLAHRDLDLALDVSAEPLPPATRLAVKEALQAIDAVLNAVSAHYLDTTTMFDLGLTGHDALKLLHVVRAGLDHDRERIERVKRGERPFTDLKPDPI